MVTSKPSSFIIFIAFATVQLLSTPASAEEAYGRTYADPLVMFALKNSNVRAGPGPNHQIVGLLKTGEKAMVTGKSGNWYALEAEPKAPNRFVYAPLLATASPPANTRSDTNLTTETFTYAGGDQYQGQTLNGKRHGRGVYTWASGGRYEGSYRDDKREGQGVQTFTNGNRYEGSFQNSKKTGHGVYTWGAGGRYEGGFLNGQAHGHGTRTWTSGDRYEGEYQKGHRTGHGIYTWASGSRYEGEFLDGKFNGHGVRTWTSGERYDGPWKNNIPYHIATKAQVERARRCIENLGHGRYRNNCDRQVAFNYCYTGTKGVIRSCPIPALKAGANENVGYYDYVHDAYPGDAFSTPFGNIYGVTRAVCPGHADGTYYLAVAKKSGKYICRSMLPDFRRLRADAHDSAVRARTKADKQAAAQAKLQRDLEEEEQWGREQDLKDAERRRRTIERRTRTRNEIQRLKAIIEQDRTRRASQPQCKPDVACSGNDDTECLAWMAQYRGLPRC